MLAVVLVVSAQWSPTPAPRFGTKKPQSSESGFRGLSVEPWAGEICKVGDGGGEGLCDENGEAQENQELRLLAPMLVGVGGQVSETVEEELMLPDELGRGCCWSVIAMLLKADGNMVVWVFAGTNLDGLGDLELGVDCVGVTVDCDLEWPW